MLSMQTHRKINDQRGSHRRYTSARSAVITGIFILCLIVGALQFAGSGHAQAAGQSTTNIVQGSVSPLIARSRLIGPADGRRIISLSIGFHAQNEAALNKYAQDIYRHGSVNSHRYLSPAQFAGIYAPTRSSYDAATQFITAAGFTITNTYIQRLLIGFRGTIAQAEQAFHVSINNYIAPDGHTYFANSSNPVLPAWSAGVVQSVNGLNDAENYVHQSVAGKSVVKQSHVAAQSATSCPVAGSGYYLPSQLATAYNLNGLYNVHGYHGEGQTIALFELAGYLPSDLTAYADCFGSRKVPVQSIVVGAGPVAMDAGVGEVELDADVILSAAPQLGNLKIYQSSQADYLTQWAQIVNDAIPVVSTSWGQCEQLVDPATMSQENTLFTTASVQGQSIFAASGDTGSADCFQSNPAMTGLAVDDPASQPYVTAVGGTSLTQTAGVYSETTWNTTGIGASGGGLSQYWAKPAYQGGVADTPCTSVTTCRQVPDVSLNADPNNGYLVYCTLAAACGTSSAWHTFGGTSAAAPMWAAWMALTNQYSLQDEGFNLGFLNGALYTDAGNAGNYANDFRDILTGNNDYTNIIPLSYAAGTGYDMATGLGSYNGYNLANRLEAPINRYYPASNTWYFAEGSVGGGFQEYLTLFNPSPYYVATVNVTYVFNTRASVTVSHVIAANTRLTINVNQDLNIQVTDPHQDVSAIVQSVDGLEDGVEPVVAERPMYFNHQGISSGTDTMGITNLNTSYDFPLVDSRQSGRNYYSYITMLNPSSTDTATVTVTYYTGACGTGSQAACPKKDVSIPPMQRATVSPLALGLQQQMSASVTSTGAAVPIAVERPEYMRDTFATAGGLTTGAATTTGSTAPANDWLFAEGYTGTNFQEYLVLSNFSATTTAAASIKLEYTNGTSQTVVVSVPALGQTFFDVNNAYHHPASGCTCTPTNPVSAEVTSGVNPIVAERLMYFHQGSGMVSGVTEVVGEPGPAAHDTYLFSEGYTANNFNEYLTLQNPITSDETVAVTLFVDSYVFEEQFVVKAMSRFTISINDLVTPIVKAHLNMGSDSYDVSFMVQAIYTATVAEPVVIAERPMYFNYNGMQGGTDVIGYPSENQ